jgi:hypothetical protein
LWLLLIPFADEEKSGVGTLDWMTWQQDEAKIHRDKDMQYLDGQFGDKMLALDSTQGVKWAPLIVIPGRKRGPRYISSTRTCNAWID